jgi:hypothetical protein
MKKGPDALGTTENESGSAKHETDALNTAENDSERAKHENVTRRTRHRQKRVRENKT